AAGGGEDHRGVAVAGGVDLLDRGVDVRRAEDGENRAEELLDGGRGVLGDAVEDRRAEVRAARARAGLAAVEHRLGAFAERLLDLPRDPLARVGGDQRAYVRRVVAAGADGERAARVDHGLEARVLLGLAADQHQQRAGQAALPGGAEGT